MQNKNNGSPVPIIGTQAHQIQLLIINCKLLMLHQSLTQRRGWATAI